MRGEMAREIARCALLLLLALFAPTGTLVLLTERGIRLGSLGERQSARTVDVGSPTNVKVKVPAYSTVYELLSAIDWCYGSHWARVGWSTAHTRRRGSLVLSPVCIYVSAKAHCLLCACVKVRLSGYIRMDDGLGVLVGLRIAALVCKNGSHLDQTICMQYIVYLCKIYGTRII